MSVTSEQEYVTRIAALERQCATLAAEVDSQRVRERALSDAYLRLRQLIGRKAFDTPHAPTVEQVWTTTEIALADLVAQVDRMRPVVDSAIATTEHGCGLCIARLDNEVATYQMAQLAAGDTNQ